jgi:hypothetical protein
MKKVLSLLFLPLLLFVFANAQTADEIVNKYVEATGGADKWKSVKTLYMEGVIVMQNGNEVNSKVYKVQDKLYRREIDFGMGSMIIIVTDKQGWYSNPRTNGAFENMPDVMYKNLQTETDIAGPLVDYNAKGNKVELVGKENINGKTNFQLKLTQPSGREITYYIDSATSYVSRVSFKGGMQRPGSNPDAVITVDFSNYQKTPEGLVFPMTVSTGGMGGAMNYEKLEVNKPIDEEKLNKPTN